MGSRWINTLRIRRVIAVQLMASVVGSLTTNGARAQQGPYDLQLLPILPPYCRYSQGYNERVPGADNPAEIERWKRAMGARNFLSIHHYCIGLSNTHRALFKSTTKRERDWELKVSIKEFDYVIAHATPDFVLLPEILTKRGENLLRLGKPEAIPTLMRAIDAKADYWPPYAALSDHYKAAGDIEKARMWLEKGIAASPDAKALQRRLRELPRAAAPKSQ